MMIRIASEQRLPFALLVPNEETVGALPAAHRDELVTVGGLCGLGADLYADDEADCRMRAPAARVARTVSPAATERHMADFADALSVHKALKTAALDDELHAVYTFDTTALQLPYPAEP